MEKFLPDRKFWSMGVSGLVAGFVSMYADVPSDVAVSVVGGVMAVVMWATPQGVNDVIKRGDEFVKMVNEMLYEKQGK